MFSSDPYYTRVAWRDDTTVLIWFANRVQNRSIVMLCDATAQTCVKVHVQDCNISSTKL